MSWRYYGYFPPSRPKAVKGGIKAQSKRGTFGESWWAKRWILTLERFDIGARLQRGRSYARSGQVMSVEVGKGTVSAKVQGSRSTPYSVKIKVKTLSDKEWNKAAAALSKQAIHAAKLLAGEMPQDIEEVFKKAGLSLFPERLDDLKTDCSCPDWSNPCKHIAAVYYLLGEEFDRDPFLIFRLRGTDRDAFLKSLAGEGESGKTEGKALRGKKQKSFATENIAPRKKAGASVPKPEPLCADPAAFWEGGGGSNGESAGEIVPPAVNAVLLKKLGPFPFWRGEFPFLETLEPVYAGAWAKGTRVLAGGGEGNGETHAADAPAAHRWTTKESPR